MIFMMKDFNPITSRITLENIKFPGEDPLLKITVSDPAHDQHSSTLLSVRDIAAYNMSFSDFMTRILMNKYNDLNLTRDRNDILFNMIKNNIRGGTRNVRG